MLPSNARTRMDQFRTLGIDYPDVRDARDGVFTGNLDLAALRTLLAGGNVALVGLQAFADGRHPFSLANLTAVRELADRYGVKVICDGSGVIENAFIIQRHESGCADRSIASIVKQIAKTAHIFQADGAQDPKCNTGGILTTDIPSVHEKFMNEVVVYEGLHTYGGMAGRTMEVLARGLAEMCDEAEVHWVMHQTERFCDRLAAGGVPIERGCDGAYVRAAELLPQAGEVAQDTFSVALYLSSGVRAFAHGLVGRDALVPVQIPRLALTNEQLDQVADAIIALAAQRQVISPLQATATGTWRDQMEYHWVFPPLEPFAFDTFPYQIHTIERVATLTREERQRAIRAAGYNTFLLRSADVTIDLLTDSGTSAMSTDQWAAFDAARACYTESDEHRRLVERLSSLFGYRHILPTHQGRAAEHILSQCCIAPGQLVPGNMYFTTTKLHQELAGGVFADVIVDEAHDPQSNFPWKGNIDLAKLDALVQQYGAAKIAYVSFEHSVNMAGGQPASMDNMREVFEYCGSRGIPVYFDATRVVENACMIQMRHPRYAAVKIEDIVREMMLYGDGCTVSGKKDFLINIGGVLCFRDNPELARRAEDMLRIFEGNVSDGGLATADLAAIARGVEEMLDDRYIRSRIAQTGYLGRLLSEAGVPIVMPPAVTPSFSMPSVSCPTLTRTNTPRSGWRRRFTSRPGCGRWSAATSPRGATPRRGRTTARRSSWCD